MNSQMPHIQCSVCDDTGWDKHTIRPCDCDAGRVIVGRILICELDSFEAHADDALALFTQGE